MATGNEVLLKNLRLLKCGTSTIVLGAALAVAAPTAALAQSTTPEPGTTTDDVAPPVEEPGTGTEDSTPNTGDPSVEGQTEAEDAIVVTGQRRSLATSQSIKRDADTVVDSITATDIGAFPDKSVAEALQRVPGITVNRFAASDDTSHFSADPSGVIVRGLTQVRSEFNGRDVFSANSSRGLSWGDISPELMAGVDVYKNQTADLIEGGIAGLINLRTRVPFDTRGDVFQATVNVIRGDRRKKFSPEVSGTYSNRWDTSLGELGFLLNGAFSQADTQSDGVVNGRTAVFQDVYGPGLQYIPSSVGLRENDYDRKRFGLAAAAQWRDPSGTLLATTQFNRSTYKEQWRERGVVSYMTDLFAFPANFVFTQGGAFSSRIPRPAPGTADFTFDEDGNFETGSLNNQQTDFSWWGGAAELPNFTGAAGSQIAVNDQGGSMFSPCYSWGNADDPTPGSCGADARGPDLNAVTRFNDNRRKTQDAALNLKWNAADNLDLSFDAQYVRSTVENYDVEVGQYSFANVALDASGGVPTLTFSDPTNINQSAGGLANPNNYRYNHAMDHVEDSEGEELAFRTDATYRIESDWLSSLAVGARYADRDQDVRYSAYNWGNISNNWNLGSGQAAYWNIDRTSPSGAFNGYPTGLIDVRDFRGGEFAFFDMGRLENGAADLLSFSNLGVGQDQWQPVCSNGGADGTGPRAAEVEGTCFRPDELNRVSEATMAGYAVLRFGGPDARIGGLGFRGNVGMRFVQTRNKVAGSTVFPNAFTSTECNRNVAPAGQPQSAVQYSIGCYLFGNAALLADPTRPPPAGFTDIALTGSPEALAFANSGSFGETVKTTHRNLLPSLNLRVDLSPTWLVRFAASRAMSRPDIGLLRNYTTLSAQLPGNDPNDARYIKDTAGNIVGVAPSYLASGYNPSLKPVTATQFDLSLENYFSDVGYFSVAGFYKKFRNYIQYGSRFEDFTNNGVTERIERRGPENGRGGSILGFEGSFQRFFDFLPGALSGFGVQLNGTYVRNKGIENSGLKNQSGSDGGSQAQPGTGGTTLTVASLEGLSKYAFNIVGMYEKYGLAVRLAYNWRSKFLVSAVDCCTYLPTWQDATGYLDGTIRYGITSRMELSLQANNLLNTETRLRQQVTGAEDGAVRIPSSWFRNDRRFTAGVRFKF
uniref:TonB-dependent receptor n=1 Tax=uncultured Sphingomonas sp. TaxID=158754 RepID=UPI0025D07D0D|nr:TonB-dependent receptor [uncultured Sphingomonas sp.]